MSFKTSRRFEHLVGFLVRNGGQASFEDVQDFLGSMAYRYSVFVNQANRIPGVHIQTIKDKGRVVGLRLTEKSSVVTEQDLVERARRQGMVVAVGV